MSFLKSWQREKILTLSAAISKSNDPSKELVSLKPGVDAIVDELRPQLEEVERLQKLLESGHEPEPQRTFRI